MFTTKLIAMYLPQYHCIPENDRFWGKGFTDWESVRKAKPLFRGHKQPRIPYNYNYYDLSIADNVVWQSKLAKDVGIYGFGVYHYWFNNDTNLLTKPATIIRDNDQVEINYFLAWDNANWVRSWSNVKGNDWAPLQDDSISSFKGPQVLIPYILGKEEDWRLHFQSILSHFKSPKYIKVDNKPVFIIFNYSQEIQEMCDYWDYLARDNGFNGMHFIMRYKWQVTDPAHVRVFKYEPVFSGWHPTLSQKAEDKIRRILKLAPRINKYSYSATWKRLLKSAEKHTDCNIYHGAFVSYDDTPRRGKKGTIVTNCTPKKFKSYLSKLIKINDSQNKDFIFLTAWNEWGEGAMLEPSADEKMRYLDAVRSVTKG